jgi:hypothetical protein
VLTTVAGARADGNPSSDALAAGYDLVFVVAAGLGVAIALVGTLLPRVRASID